MSVSENSETPDTFEKRNKHLLETGKYFDFIIECGGRQFKVHRSIICPQSKFLEILCNSSFEEGIAKKASLKETDAEIFERSLDFLYTGTYNDGCFGILDNTTQWADKNLLQQAERSSTATMREEANTACNSPAQITVDQGLEDHFCKARTFEGSALLVNIRLYNLADFLQVSKLKAESLQRCKELMEKRFDAANFADGIKEALTHVNEQDLTLSAQVFKSCVENWQKVANYPVLDDLLTEYQPIAWMVSKEKVAELENGHNEQTLNVCRLTEQVSTLEAQVSIVEEELAQVYKLVSNHGHCRNCGQEFGGCLEKLYQGKILLRCSKCRCRHE